MTNEVLGLPLWVIILIVVVIILLIVAIFVGTKKMQSKFTTAHPDAASIYFTSTKNAMLSSIAAVGDQISIASIDGIVVGTASPTGSDFSAMASALQDRKKAANLFAVMGSYILVVPGQHTLSLTASHSRPGVTAKTVATTYGPYDVQVNLQPSTSYQLNFDRDSQQFSIALREDK